jgi:hypothetical protein
MGNRAYVVEKTNLEDVVNHYNLSVFDSIIMTPTNGWAQGIIRGAQNDSDWRTATLYNEGKVKETGNNIGPVF